MLRIRNGQVDSFRTVSYDRFWSYLTEKLLKEYPDHLKITNIEKFVEAVKEKCAAYGINGKDDIEDLAVRMAVDGENFEDMNHNKIAKDVLSDPDIPPDEKMILIYMREMVTELSREDLS